MNYGLVLKGGEIMAPGRALFEMELINLLTTDRRAILSGIASWSRIINTGQSIAGGATASTDRKRSITAQLSASTVVAGEGSTFALLA